MGVDLKKVENFKYVGRQIYDIDLDSTALFMNLCKACRRFTHHFWLIAREGADPIVGGKIYVAQQSYQYYCFVRIRNLGVEPWYAQ